MDVPALWKDTNIFYNILCFLITENEKLFDRNDARLYWRTVIHIFAIIHHNFIAVYPNSLDLANNPEGEIRKLYTFRLGLLTGWNFCFQTVFLFLALTHDILEWMNKQDSSLTKKIGYWRDIIFNALVVPYTVFVTSMFWTLYWIDRELVFPQIYDSIMPWWFNHCVHTNIAVVILVETLLTPRKQPANRNIELIFNSIVGFGYAIVYYSIHYFTNRWLYNVFGVLTWWQVCLYQLFIWSCNYIFYFIHFPINRLVHGCDIDEKTIEDRVDRVDRVDQVECTEGIEDKTDSNGVPKNLEIGAMQKPSSGFEPFSSDNWSLKYRSLRDKFENSRL